MHHPFDVLHHDDGVVHQQADGQHHAEHGQGVDAETGCCEDAEGTQQHYRYRHGGDHRGTEVLQEQEHHQEHQDDGLHQRLDHALDGFGHHWGGVVREYHLHAWREEGLQVADGLAQRLGGIQRVGAVGQFHRQAGSRVAIELGADGVVLAAQGNVRDVAQAYLRTILVDLQQDRLELLGGLQASLADDGGVQLLARHGRQAAKLTGGHLDVLSGDRGLHVHRGQVVVVQLGRVEPDPHGVLGTEHLEVTDTRGPGDRVLHVRHDVVRQVVLGHAAVLGNHADHQQEVLHRLGHADALLLYFLRQQRGGQVELVLHLDLRGIGVGALLEGRGDGHAAVGVTFRGHITQVVDAVELLLDHLDHGVLHGLRRGTRIGHGDRDRGRRDARVLVDRQFEDR